MISTYGIIFLGTPHQGVENVDLGLLLLDIQSIYSKTNKTVLKHLQRDSELLQTQLSQYASISGNFDTKFFFEVYPTRIFGGMQRMVSFVISFYCSASHIWLQLVSRSSAVVPGIVNAEAIAINKDHVGIAKFASSNDEDFQTICGHLNSMVSMAPQRITEKWSLDKRHEGL